VYTIAEASSATGVSEQAIRRRIERGTLTAWVPAGERRRVMTHEELLRVGLLRGAPRATRTRRGIMRMIEYLRGDPTRSLTTEELRWHTQRPRQTLEVALAVLRAAGVVTRGYHAGFGQYTWSWSDEP
jgi:excisionase family DNA binding protein